MRGFRLVFLWLCVVVAACVDDPTRVVLYIFTDLPWGPEAPDVPHRIQSLGVRVASQDSPDQTISCTTIPLGRGERRATLPGNFIVMPRGGDRTRRTLVEVAACRGTSCLCDDAGAQAPFVVRRLWFTYPNEGTQHVLVFLARACGDFMCPMETTCRADDGVARCESPETRPEAGPPVPPPDATDDASVSSDVDVSDASAMDESADHPVGMDEAPPADVVVDMPAADAPPADRPRDVASEASCPAGRTRCSMVCVDLQSDRANCGGCGVGCTGGQVCAIGRCQTTCPYVMCGSDCVDTWASREHCGSCNNACRGDQTCQGAGCVCRGGTSDCGGACVDTQSDRQNCGACGAICPAGQTCGAGRCMCAGGTTACGAGCVNTQTDANNCGTCGTQCGSGQSCTSGACRCAAGTLCGGGCVNTQTDVENCGACGVRCGTRQTCSAGGCACIPGMCGPSAICGSCPGYDRPICYTTPPGCPAPR